MIVDFDKHIQNEIDERESIMFEIERALFTRRYNLSSKHQNIFWAHSISMLYSVWEGFVQNGVVVCPWHQWEFQVTDGKCLSIPTHGVESYPVEIKEESVWVEIKL